MIAGSQSVAMTYHQLQSVDLSFYGFANDCYAQFFRKIIEHPHIVIACEHVYFNPRIAEFSQFAQQTHIAPWHNGFILEPEIEKVAQNIKLGSIGSDHFEPADQLLFTYQAFAPIRNA